MSAVPQENDTGHLGAAPSAAPRRDDTLAGELRAMAHGARDIALAEAALQKARAGYAAAILPRIAAVGVIGFGLLFTAVMALTFGLVLGLAQLSNPWMATAIVVGGLAASAIACVLLMRRWARRLRLALFGLPDPLAVKYSPVPGRRTTFADIEAARAGRDAARGAFDARTSAMRDDIEEHGVAGLVAEDIGDRARDVFDEAVAIADDNRAIVAGTLAALVIWFLRNPLLAALDELLDGRLDKLKNLMGQDR